MKKTFFSLFDKVVNFINIAMYVVVGIAVLGFIWGLVKLIFNSNNEVAKKEGRDFMLYGILTLFVMTSLWGLVNLLQGVYIGDVNDYSEEVKDMDPANNVNPFDDVKDLFNSDQPQAEV